MLYEISTADQSTINWSANGVDRIIQNVINLINTLRHEISYNRLSGISDVRHLPFNQASAIITNEIRDVVVNGEPRATVKSVKLLNIDKDGNTIIEVVVDI